MIISLGRAEQQEVGLDLSGEDLLGSLVVEVNDKGQGLGGHKLGNILLFELEIIYLDVAWVFNV